MARWLCGRSVRGASHVRSGMPCQDNYRIEEISEDISVIAVADGHGSEKSPKSRSGSRIAVNVFCSVMKKYLQNYAGASDDLVTYLNRDGELRFAQEICEEWQRRVRDSFNKSKEEKPISEDGSVRWKDVYRMYGTTLLGLLIAPTFIFAFQIGDGDIVLVDQDQVSPVVEAEKFLGTETHSLSKPDAWRKAVTAVRRRAVSAGTPYLYMLSTDGFINSFVSEEDHRTACRDYYGMIQEHGFDAVANHLATWLSETSELGCGDDITLVLAYYS